MLSSLLFASLMSQSPTTPVVDPVREVHRHFEEACGSLDNLISAQEKLRRLGWEVVTPDAASKFGRVVAFVNKESAALIAEEGGVVQKPLVFERKVSGRVLNIMLQAVIFEGVQLNGCRLWDFEAERPRNIGSLADLGTRKPERIVDQDGLMLVSWDANPEAGTGKTQYVFIPADHTASKLTGASGLSFKTSIIRITSE